LVVTAAQKVATLGKKKGTSTQRRSSEELTTQEPTQQDDIQEEHDEINKLQDFLAGFD
jgi:hypothetical protein